MKTKWIYDVATVPNDYLVLFAKLRFAIIAIFSIYFVHFFGLVLVTSAL